MSHSGFINPPIHTSKTITEHLSYRTSRPGLEASSAQCLFCNECRTDMGLCMAAALVNLCLPQPAKMAVSCTRCLPHKPCAWHAATLVDTVGSAALVTKVENAGVSLHISVDYLSRSATAWHAVCCQPASAPGVSWSAELAHCHGCSMPGDET